MAAHMLQVSSLFAVRLKKCDHIEAEKSFLKNIDVRRTLEEVFEYEHGVLPKSYVARAQTSADDKNIFDVNMNLTVAEINRDFKMRYLYFQCEKQEQEDNLQELVSMVNKAAEKAKKQTVNAFERMMFNGREFTPKREPRYKNNTSTQSLHSHYC